MAAILVENLVKQYQNGVQALRGLTLTVQEGQIFSLLGQNGAGKSTLINILTTYLRPTSGNVQMLGKDIYKEAAAIRSKIACVAQKNSIDMYLSLEENMMFQGSLYKISKIEAQKRMKYLINCFELERYLQYPVASYSGGVRRRLDIALNMMSQPQILFLDEPTVGMDVQSRRAMWEMIGKICGDFGTTIFLTTHYLDEADQLSDTICIINDGAEIMQGTPFSLRKYLRQDRLKISFADKDSARLNLSQISELFINRKVELREANILIPVDNGQQDLSQAGQFLFKQHITFTGIELMQPTLEDVFICLTNNKEDYA